MEMTKHVQNHSKNEQVPEYYFKKTMSVKQNVITYGTCLAI